MDVKVESGGHGRKSRVIPVRYRIRCDPTALDREDAPGSAAEPPAWPTDEGGFLAYTDEERDEITAALDRVAARYQVFPEEPEVYHIACDVEAAASATSEHRSWSRSDAGFVAPTAAERDRIQKVLTRARIPYAVNVRVPSGEFLRQLEARVTTRSAALAAMATGTVPPVLDDITEVKGRVDELAAAAAKMPEGRTARVSRGGKELAGLVITSSGHASVSPGNSIGEMVSAGTLLTIAGAFLVAGLGHLGEGRVWTGCALLAPAWLLVLIALCLLPNLRRKWKWCGFPIVLWLAVGGVILLLGILGSRPTAVSSEPSGIPRERQLTDAAAAPSPAGPEGSATSPGVEPAEPESKAPVQRAEGPPPPAAAPVAADKARPLNVELRFLQADPMPPRDPRGRPLASLELRIANPNEQPVFVNKAGVALPNGTVVDAPPVTDSAWKIGDAIPPHQNYSLTFRDAELLELCDIVELVLELRGKVLLVGWCEDGDGKRHESAPVEFDVELARHSATEP